MLDVVYVGLKESLNEQKISKEIEFDNLDHLCSHFLIFDDKKKFEEKMGNYFSIKYEELTECLIFLNSGGVTSKTLCIPMNNFFMNILNSVDSILIKIFPSFFINYFLY